MFKHLVHIVLVLVFFLTQAVYSSDFSIYAETGKQAFEKEDYESAKTAYLKAMETWTSTDSTGAKYPVLVALGSILMTERKYNESIKYFLDAQKLNPRDGRNYFRIGLVYSVQNKAKEAIPPLVKSIQYEPRFFMAYKTLGEQYRKTRQYDLAIATYLKALKLNTKSDSVYEGLGEAYRTQQKWDLAIKHLQKAVQVNPNNALAHYNLALCFMEKKQYDRVIEQCNLALNAKVIIPDAFKVQVMTYLGMAYENKGDTEKSKEYYRKARQLLDEIPVK